MGRKKKQKEPFKLEKEYKFLDIKTDDLSKALTENIVFTILKEFNKGYSVKANVSATKSDQEFLDSVIFKKEISQVDMVRWQKLVLGKALVSQATISRCINRFIKDVVVISGDQYRITKSNKYGYTLISPDSFVEYQLFELKNDLKKYFLKNYSVNLHTAQSLNDLYENRMKEGQSDDKYKWGPMFLFHIAEEKTEVLKKYFLDTFAEKDIYDVLIYGKEEVIVILNYDSERFTSNAKRLHNFFKS